MKLEGLTIRGFMHRSDEAVLDLTSIPVGSLIAITGPNGGGKTTLLDAGFAGLYGEFPSRDGHLFTYATERDAFIDVLYSVEGRGTYRSRINVDGPKRAIDGVLEQVRPDGSRVPLNDGKISTHRDAVREVFPSKAPVLASAFSAQNRNGSFIGKSRAEKKDLFSELLGLLHYERMAATAKTCHDAWESTRLQLFQQRVALLRETSDEVKNEIHDRGNDVMGESFLADQRRDELQLVLDAVQVERTGLLEQARAHLDGLQRRQALSVAIAEKTTELAQIAKDEATAQADYTADVERAGERRDAAITFATRADLAACETYAALEQDLVKRIAGNQTLNAQADEIRAAAAELELRTKTLGELRQQQATARNAMDEAKEQRDYRETRLAELARIEAEITALEQRAGLLTRVKFGDQCGGDAPCVLVVNAVEAQAKLPDLRTKLHEKPTLQEGKALWSERYGSAHERHRGYDVSIASTEQEIARLKVSAKYAGELAATEARIAGYEQQKTQAADTLAAQLQDVTAQQARAEQTYQVERDQLEDTYVRFLHSSSGRAVELKAGLQDDHAQMDAVRASLETTAAAATRLAILDDQELPTLNRQWAENEATRAACAERMKMLERDRAMFIARVRERSDVEDRLRAAEDRSLLWQTCVKAFSRDGLPTLEIAASGPTISTLTNDLLEASFGPRFTVELITQEAKADGKGLKEAFDLRVIDNASGGEPRAIEDVSGGERVVIEEALRCGISLFVNSRNQQVIRTVFRDETTGALDPENATRYISMLRRLVQLGGLSHLLFVTHSPDCAALADVEICVVDGQPNIARRAA